MINSSDIMTTWRKPLGFGSGTVAEHCSNCSRWDDGWCRSFASNVRKTEWDRRCEDYASGQETYLNR